MTDIKISPDASGLTAEQRELLAYLLEEEGIKHPQTRAIPPREDLEEPLPLSFAQERLWFLDQLEPGSAAYNIPAAYRLEGSLDVDALKRSLNGIVRRHEALRTTFEVVDGQPVQVIASELSLTLPLEDLRGLPEAEREAEVERLTAEEAQGVFDLSGGPLLRARLLRLDEEEHVLLVTMHHVVSDGWSMGVFNRELSALYEAFSAGESSPLPKLPIQYADFAVWQRERLQGEVLEEQLGYWREQLGGDLPVLELPTDRPRPAAQTFRGARQSLALSNELTESLKALSRREGVTLFMTLIAAFKVLLYRYTGQEDVVVGTPVAGRGRSEIEGLIGFFVNTLVLRTDLSGDPTFQELLGRVREVTLEAQAHQDLPFVKLVAELQPERNLSHNPLFDIMLNFVYAAKTALELPEVTVSLQKPAELESKFLMTLYVQEHTSKLCLQLVYRQALFSAERMAFFLDQFRYLLEQVVAAPGKPIRSYSLVTPKSRILLPDPSAALPEPRYELITDMFSSWANNTPQHPAIRQGDRTWTYSDLAKSARAAARALLARGFTRGDVVAISGARSFGLVASMLGVFLSGGVLLTLDRSLPTERQRVMLAEAGAEYLLNVDGRQVEDEWLYESMSLVSIGVDPDKGLVIKPERSSNLEEMPLPEPDPDDAAYVFFTSGTTGVPKGVLGCHKGLSHFLHWQRERFAIGPGDRNAQLTALSFDVVLRDIILPLTSGATLCLPREPDALGPDQVFLWLERERITFLHAVPALAQAWLMDVPAGVSLRSLRWVFFAGEPLPAALVSRWREVFPESGEIVNLYGPTETTLAKCFYVVPSDPLPGAQPVGWPLPQAQALVLRETDQMCGISEPGEIVLRTPFRSLGYINAPEENRKRFVRNPFRDNQGDLLYYTGDRGRYRPDGSLEILGRLDEQVKIRGTRIEPAEIMATLSQYPGVRSCHVVARRGEEGKTYLVAYVVKSKQDRVSPKELRSYLGKRLPAAMIPSAFVFLERLPLTANGKLDREALAAPDVVRPEPRSSFVAPRTSVEKELARIWAEILDLETVGVYDSFFELGGDSLLGIQMVARAHREGLQFTPRQLLQYPTISELAAMVSSHSAIHAEQGLVTGPVPLLPSQHYLIEKMAPVQLHHCNSARLLEARQPLDISLLEEVAQHLAMHHDALRIRFAREKPGWRQFIAVPGDIVPLSRVDLSSVAEEEQETAIEATAAQSQASLNLSEGPIWRLVLFDLGAHKPSYLLIIVHHLAFDGMSWYVLLEDLETAYRQLRRGEPITLPTKTTSTKDWAERLEAYARSPALRQERDYWVADRWRHAPGLPVDYPGGRERNTLASGCIISASLSFEETRALTREVEGTCRFQIRDVLLTALAQTFTQWTGDPSLMVHILSHGRDGIFEDIDLSRTVGFLAVGYPALLNLGEANTIRDALRSIKKQLRSIPNGGFSYPLLYYLNKDAESAKALKALPEADVAFNYVGQFVSEYSLFRIIRKPIGPTWSLRADRTHLLHIDVGIVNGQLESRWEYGENIHRRATIEQLAQGFVEALQSLIGICLSSGENT